MAQTRTATPVIGTIAAILVGGAVATGVGAFLMFFGIYETDVLAEVRRSMGYYAVLCFAVGFFTAIGLMLTRPRGPVAPIVAVVAAYVALYVGTRLGVLLYVSTHGGTPGWFLTDLLKPHFEKWDVLAPLAAGALGGLRVVMVAGSLAPRGPSGPPFPPPGGHGQPYPPGPGAPPVPGPPSGPPPGGPFPRP
ncbi:hypothetical protein SAMN05443665_103639 [Actinomadura meyerae]|uniref:Uncharacterized protein n=1 Tax=Actinomadura meyerae TaxID=240840 RepID=A0A239N4Y6_9ACTN|nr:hypothetical protein [Actinomadura meyerae]SNT50011.1 hypothetical protein SAMN05443665_103639 [Actinomadura meyerae]